jgi:hypothetical protein
MNRDFVEMLSALVEAQTEFLIVGAHAPVAGPDEAALWRSGFGAMQLD